MARPTGSPMGEPGAGQRKGTNKLPAGALAAPLPPRSGVRGSKGRAVNRLNPINTGLTGPRNAGRPGAPAGLAVADGAWPTNPPRGSAPNPART